MELDFANKGLSLFDATVLDGPASGGQKDALLRSATSVDALNLSNNSIRLFRTGESLRFVTTIDLSHNALNTLRHSSLPSGLMKLNVSHNELEDLSTLGRQCPRLQVLDASHNALTSAGCAALSGALTTLHLQHNEIDSLAPFSNLTRLQKLVISFNAIEVVAEEELAALAGCKALRTLDMRDNLCLDAAHDATVARLALTLPRLSMLNGVPQSQAADNVMTKAARRREAASASTSSLRQTSAIDLSSTSTRATGLSPHHARGGSATSATRSTIAAKRGTRRQPQVPLAVRAMETKVQELYRLLAEATKEEAAALQDRNLIAEQIQSLSGVIDGQASEMQSLQEEIERLKAEEAALREPLSELEQTFEQNHASLIAHRVQGGINTTV